MERREARRPNHPLVSTDYEAGAEQGLARGVYPLSMLSKALGAPAKTVRCFETYSFFAKNTVLVVIHGWRWINNDPS